MVVRRLPPDPRAVQHWPDVPMRPRTRRRLAIAIPLILVLAAAGCTARWMYTDRQSNEPVEALRAFLEASRSGDVEAALSLTSGAPEGTEELLVPEAMSAEWEILDLGLNFWSPTSEHADVWATVKGPNDTELTTTFDLIQIGNGDWKVDDPFTTLSLEDLPVPYFDVNGFTQPLETDPREGYQFALLPGVYQLYEQPPAFFTYEAEPLLALGDMLVNADGAEVPHLRETFEGFTLTEGGEAELNERLTAYLDECMANPEGPETFGCPFGLQERDIDVEDFTLADDNRWEIIEYPQAAASGYRSAVYTQSELVLLTRHEGRARVTASDEATGEQVVLECPLTTRGLYLAFGQTGDYTIGPNQDPNASTDPARTSWDDGYESLCEPT
ncbi:hypothetical protein O1R50_22650 [Glycomyces luteolus]|uniref:Uncharacterized protein n=1 Tax=Glycomyces luteolus TaxID=2670330 RepID=A0A9X3SS32_9ACTN|nr:hypothetical protein [Glycomyces luteolus]MDA1362442.1 hypothetical protein [Glycomyces luteolus]